MEMYQYTCTKCKKVHHPHYVVCQNPDCDGREFDSAPLGGKCKLLTWTRAYNLPEGFEMPWLNFGIVEFPNGVRATGQIGFDEGIESGMELIAKSAKVRDKIIKYKETVPEARYGFVFQRAES